MAQLVNKIPVMLKGVADKSRPKLQTFMKYAVVELTPPTPADIPQIIRSVGSLIYSATTMQWRHLTVREAWRNTLVATEIGCWFFVGECIGKRHIIGYQV